MSHIARRVSRLEGAAEARWPSRRVVRIIVENESADHAIENYRAEHPDVPDDALFIVREIVVPKHREAD
jgi:hypothetical protein